MISEFYKLFLNYKLNHEIRNSDLIQWPMSVNQLPPMTTAASSTPFRFHVSDDMSKPRHPSLLPHPHRPVPRWAHPLLLHFPYLSLSRARLNPWCAPAIRAWSTLDSQAARFGLPIPPPHSSPIAGSHHGRASQGRYLHPCTHSARCRSAAPMHPTISRASPKLPRVPLDR